MAQIITYPKLSTLANNDLLIVSDVSSVNKTTNSLEVDTLAQHIIVTNNVITGGGTIRQIPMFTPTGVIIGDSIMRQSSGGFEIQIGGSLDVTDEVNIAGNLNVANTLTIDGGSVFNSQVLVNYDVASPSNFISFAPATFYRDISMANNFGTLPNPNLRIFNGNIFLYDQGRVKDMLDPVDSQDAATKAYVDAQNAGQVSGTGTTNVLPIWTDGPNSVLGDSLITQTKVDGGTIFDLNAVTTTNYTPAINTKLLDLNSGGAQKFSITQDGGGGVVLPAGGGVTNPGPSFNMGSGAFSNGKSGVAMGTTTTAFGNGSLAANFLTLASGGGASAFGLLTEASALASASFGNKSKATGAYSIASGQDSIASGQSSVAIGEKGDAQGKNTFVSGFGGTATANNAVKFGYEGSASGTNSAKFGFESVASGPNSFAVGDGTTASGFQSIATGDNNIASGQNSFVGGKNSTITGSESIAYGLTNTISANSCAIFGNANNIPSGGFQSFIAGNNNTAGTLGKQKLIGSFLTGPAATQDGVYLGSYNDDTDNYSKFQIGNGSVSGKSNALSINNAGNIKIPTYGSGAVTGNVAYNLAVAANGQIIETPPSGAPDYLSFVCLLSQSGTANPQPNIVLENSLGIASPFTAFTRVSAGVYNLNATGKFKSLKTIMLATSGQGPSGTSSNIGFSFVDADNLRITTSGADNFTKIAIEIRTYN